ncbi:hypothetical protein AB0G98_24705 [Streptomyces sp. NPDC020196]|uniref:hypothetical protein n=1 Tax=Streptomyces TaxID=1883 RepID=UPI0033DA6AF0
MLVVIPCVPEPELQLYSLLGRGFFEGGDDGEHVVSADLLDDAVRVSLRCGEVEDLASGLRGVAPLQSDGQGSVVPVEPVGLANREEACGESG